VKSLPQWLQYLEGLHPRPIDMGLARVDAVRAALGLELAMPVLTVGGTNGKGSICAFLEAILREAGFRVGLYTSPHILRYNERVRIDGVEASDAALISAFERVEHARAGISLTYFEFGTLAAAILFAEAKLDAVILEVGLGGRLDAVNIFDADCAIVASVDLDHMNFLGDTREAIGREKAGIFRAGRPAICADPAPPSSLREYAREVGARLAVIGEDFGYTRDGLQWRYRGPQTSRNGLPHPALRGAHQLGNAAAAIAALDAVRERLPVGMQAVRMGLVTASVPGRFQVLPGRPAVVLDVGHNPHAARALAGTLQEHGKFRRTLAVFGMLADKDVVGVIEAIRTQVSAWYVAGLAGERGLTARLLSEMVARIDAGKSQQCFDTPAQAYRSACSAAAEDDRILVFGSFHTVADVLAAIDAAKAAERSARS